MASLVSTTVNGDLKVTGSSNLFFEGSASSNTFEPGTRIYGAGITLTGGAYTSVFEYTVPAGLAGNFRFFVKGTTGNVVIPTQVDVLLNHSKDITIKSQTGNYTPLHVKVLTNDNEDCLVQIKADTFGDANVTVYIDVIAFGDGSVSFSSFGSYTGESLEHKCNFGFSFSTTNNTVVSKFVMDGGNTDGGRLGIGTNSPAQPLDVLGKVSINTDGTLNWGASKDYGRLTWSTTNSRAIVRGESGKNLSLGANGTQDYVFIKTDGNVGIGTTNPSYKLDVDGTLRTTGQATFNVGATISNNQNLNIGTTGSNTGYVRFYNNNATAYYIDWESTGTRAYRYHGSSSSGAYTTTFSQAGTGGHNVSVLGTLQVTPAASEQGITIGDASKGEVPLIFKGGSGSHSIGQNGAGFFICATSTGNLDTNPRLTINSGGNVGIGTNNPGYKLDIGGVGSSVNNTIRLNQNNGGTAIRIGAGGGSSDVTLLRVDGESSAGNHDGATDSSEYGFSLKYMGARSGNANSLSIFSDNQNAASQIEVVTIYQDGNVGIGTTTPDNPLEVFGADSGIKISSDASDRPHLRFECGTAEKLRLSANANYGAIGDSSNTNRYMVLKDGNVGIATDAPASLLHVGSAGAAPHAAANDFVIAPSATDVGMTIRCNSNSGTGSIFFADVAANAQGLIRYNHNSDYMSFYSTGDFFFDGSSGADVLFRINTGNTETDARLMIGEDDNYGMTFEYDGAANMGYLGMNDNVAPTASWSKRIQMSRAGTEVAFMAGNVGIGAESPVGDLMISRGSSAGAEIQFHGTDTAYHRLGIRKTGSRLDMGDYNNDGSAFTSILTVDGDGDRVGIGTNAPSEKLHIVNSSDPTIRITNTDGGTNDTAAFELGVSTNTAIASTRIEARRQSDGSVDLNFRGAGTTSVAQTSAQMTLDGVSGNVGIGTTQPSQKLDVNGNTELNGAVNIVGGGWLSFDGEQGLRKSGNWLYLADGGFTNGLYTRIKIRVDGYDISPYQNTASVTSATTLGISTKRWYNVYSQSGDFSGTATVGESVNAAGLIVKRASSGDPYIQFNKGSTRHAYIQSYQNKFYVTNDNGDDIDFRTGNADNLTLDHSGNLFSTKSGTLGTSANRWSTIYGAAGDFSGVVVAATGSTNGGPWLERNYSAPHKLNVLSSHYSSGNTIIGYGAAGKSGGSGFVATYGNFSGKKSVIELSGSTLYFKVTDSASQDTVGDDITLTTRLQVEKTAMTYTSSDGSGLIVNRTSNSAYLQFYPAYSSVPTIMGKGAGGLHLGYNSNTSGIRIDTSNNVIIKDNILFFGSTTGPFVSNDSTVLRLAGDGGVKIQTYVGGWQDRLTIIDDGNVGIGTTAPAEKLDVEGSLVLNVATGTGLGEEGIFFRRGFSDSNKYNISILAYAHDGAGNFSDGISINGYDGVSFCTGSDTRQERMRIVGGTGGTSGYVGIGTDGPATKLDVYSSSAALRISASGGTSPQLELSSVGAVNWKLRANISSSDFRITRDSTDYLTILSDGNVGIGTVTPTEQLTIFASVAGSPATSGTGANGNFAIESSNGNSLYFGSYNGSPYGCWLQVSNYADQSLTYPLILQPNGGNVGIGINSPAAALHVKKAGVSQPFVIFEDTGTNSNPAVSIKNDSQEWLMQTVGARNDNWEVWNQTAGATRLAIDTGGNVGIGTTAPAAPLNVNGGAVIGGITRFIGGGTHELSVNLAVSECVGFGASNSAFTYFRRYSASIETFQIQPVHSGTNNGIISMVPYGGQVHIGMGNGTAAKSLLTISGNSDNGDNACALRIIDEDDTGGSKLPAIMFYGGSTMQGRIRGGDGSFAIAVGSSPTTAISIDTSSKAITFNSEFTFPTSDGSSNQVLKTNGSGTLSWTDQSGGSGMTTDQYVKCGHRTSAGSNDGGSITALTWTTRNISHTWTNNGSFATVSTSSNWVTLAAGDYYAIFRANAVNNDYGQARLETDGGTVLVTSNNTSVFGTSDQFSLLGAGYFTLASQDNVLVKQIAEATQATYGLGRNLVGIGATYYSHNVYFTLEIWKIG